MNANSAAPGSRPASLGSARAVVDALLNRQFAHFPRVRDEHGRAVSLADKEMINNAVDALSDLAPTDPEDKLLEAAMDRARETFEEVKGLTDYQDGKATRLLTIITFLSALSGVLFTRFVEAYPVHGAVASLNATWLSISLIAASYVAFAAFALLAICGALVTFHAIRTRFRYPDVPQPGRAKSYLFYKSILEVTPDQWAGSFLDSQSRAKLAPDLKLRYFRNYVVESYLIAAKVADKLRYLEPAQALQFLAIRALLIWIVLFGATIVFVPPVERNPNPGKAQIAPSTVEPVPTNPSPGSAPTIPGQR